MFTLPSKLASKRTGYRGQGGGGYRLLGNMYPGPFRLEGAGYRAQGGVEAPLGTEGGTWLPMFIEATSRLPHACSVVDVQVAGLPLVYVNQAWEALTGYARAEVLGHNCRLLQGAETEEAAVAELVRSIRQRRPCVVTLTNYRKDGGRFANELSLHPVFDSRGVYRYIVGVSSDTSVVEAVIDPFAILIGTAREETGARMYPVPCTPPLARRWVRRGPRSPSLHIHIHIHTRVRRGPRSPA